MVPKKARPYAYIQGYNIGTFSMPTTTRISPFTLDDVEKLRDPVARAKVLESLSEGSREIVRNTRFSAEEINEAFRKAREKLSVSTRVTPG